MLEKYLSACKAYDIRGKYGTEIDERLAYFLGIGIARFLLSKTSNPKVLIGSDVRKYNTSLITAFIAGLYKENITTIWVAHSGQDEYVNYPYGLCSTASLYYLAQGEVDLAVVFTASHNPPEDVGMKFFDGNCTFLSQKFLIEILKSVDDTITLPELPEYYIIPSYPLLETKQHQLHEFLQGKFNTLKQQHTLAIDFSGGAGVALEKKILSTLLPGSSFLNDQPDGLFTAHLSETQDYENYCDVISKIKEGNLEGGCLFDGDADRIGFVGADGKVVGGDIILAIVAEQLIYENSRERSDIPLILYEVMCSQSVPEIVHKCGGKSEMVRMGRFFIKEAMESKGALFAGETSGHFMFSELGNYEMPLLVIFYVLKAIEYYGSWNDMLQSIVKKEKSPIFSRVVQDKKQVLEKVKSVFSDWKQLEVDGITCYGEGVWFNVRVSNTENKVRYTIEADNSHLLQEMLRKLEEILV